MNGSEEADLLFEKHVEIHYKVGCSKAIEDSVWAIWETIP
jgi:hypothetical protein